MKQITPLDVRNGHATRQALGMLTDDEFKQFQRVINTTGDSRSRAVATAIDLYCRLHKDFVDNPTDTTNPLRDFFVKKLR